MRLAKDDVVILIMTDDSSRSAAASMMPRMGDGEPFTPFNTVSIILTQWSHVIPVSDCAGGIGCDGMIGG